MSINVELLIYFGQSKRTTNSKSVTRQVWSSIGHLLYSIIVIITNCCCINDYAICNSSDFAWDFLFSMFWFLCLNFDSHQFFDFIKLFHWWQVETITHRKNVFFILFFFLDKLIVTNLQLHQSVGVDLFLFELIEIIWS